MKAIKGMGLKNPMSGFNKMVRAFNGHVKVGGMMNQSKRRSPRSGSRPAKKGY